MREGGKAAGTSVKENPCHWDGRLRPGAHHLPGTDAIICKGYSELRNTSLTNCCEKS